MTIHLETPRLLLRELRPEDDAGMFELDSNPAVLKYIGVPPQTHIDQSRAIIEFVRKQYDMYGVGRFAVLLKETGEFMGWAGLKYITEPMNGQVYYYDIGYRFIERFWGRGYGKEAAIASRDYAFDVLKIDKICGVAMAGNIASRKILEGIGLRFINEFKRDHELLYWFEMENTQNRRN